MKKEILGGLLATTTLLDSGMTFVGAKNGWGQEAHPLFALVINNFAVLFAMSILLTAGYIILSGIVSERYKSLKMHHYVGWATFWHSIGAISWLI